MPRLNRHIYTKTLSYMGTSEGDKQPILM
jgi:hypothetical protein